MGKPAQTGQPQTTEKPKSPQEYSTPSSSPAPKKSNKPDPVAGMCFGSGCKSKSFKFNFCDEHFHQFKFGLITKEGEQASDYERKVEHYQAYRQKTQKSKKVA